MNQRLLLSICRGGLAAGILWVTLVTPAQEVQAAEATGEEGGLFYMELGHQF